MKEIETVPEGPLDFNTLKNLSYLKNVLSETLRLYPSGTFTINPFFYDFLEVTQLTHGPINCVLFFTVPIDGRSAREDDVLPNGTPVPKGVSPLSCSHIFFFFFFFFFFSLALIIYLFLFCLYFLDDSFVQCVYYWQGS